MKLIKEIQSPNGVEYRILKYNLQDVIAHNFVLLDLQQEAFGDRIFQNRQYTNFVEYFKENPDANLFVAEVQENRKSRIVGFICDGINRDNNYMLRHAKYIDLLAVTQDYQGNKIGYNLMDSMLHCLSSAKDYGIVKLNVLTKNHKAHRLYEKFGFKDFGSETERANSMLIQINKDLELLGDICYASLMEMGDNPTQVKAVQFFKRLKNDKCLKKSYKNLPVSKLAVFFQNKLNSDLYKAVADCMTEYYGLCEINKTLIPFEQFVVNRTNEYYARKAEVDNTMGGIIISGNDVLRPVENHAPKVMQVLKSAVLSMRHDVSKMNNHPCKNHVLSYKPYSYLNDIVEIDPKTME